MGAVFRQNEKSVQVPKAETKIGVHRKNKGVIVAGGHLQGEDNLNSET